jgi:hypothetical protein
MSRDGSVTSSLMMGSPDLCDPVSPLSGVSSGMISGSPAAQMHIALSTEKCRQPSHLRAKRAVVRVAETDARGRGQGNITAMQIARCCNALGMRQPTCRRAARRRERARLVPGSAQVGDSLETLNSRVPSAHLNCRSAVCSSGRAAAQMRRLRQSGPAWLPDR